MFSFDLQDGYYGFQIHRDFQKYFTILVDGEYLQFTALPMGWNWSPYVFVKAMKVLVQMLRSPDAPLSGVIQRSRDSVRLRTAKHKIRGLRVLPYMDDFLVLAKTKEEAFRARERVQWVLDNLGLRRNPTKGVWEPGQVVEHLGLEVDTAEGQFRVTEKRMAKIQGMARQIRYTALHSNRLIPVRALASLVGIAQSVYLAIPPARFYLRELHNVISSRASWGSRVRLTPQALRDLEWWMKVPAKWNGRNIWRSPETGEVHSDSSTYAWGAVLNQMRTARGFWSVEERKQHITYLELQAVYNAVRSFLPWIRNRKILLHEDNMAVVHILTNHTSRSKPLMALLRKLWWLLDVENIELRPQYIRSAANVWADALSRDLDCDDWKINPRVFQRLDKSWGPHHVDRFASELSAQLPVYYSAHLDPSSAGTNSLSRDWRGVTNWINPPWDLLDQVAQKLFESGAGGTVVAPYWAGALWFQSLWEQSDVVEIVPPSHDLFLPTRHGASEGVGPARWAAIFFHIPARPVGRTDSASQM